MENQTDASSLQVLLKMQELKLIQDMLDTMNERDREIILNNLLMKWINENSHSVRSSAEDAFRLAVTDKTNKSLENWTPVLDTQVMAMIDTKIESYIERGFHENLKVQAQKKKADDFLEEIRAKITNYIQDQKWGK